MASNFFKDIGDELANFVDWVKSVLADEAIRKSIADDLGLEPGQSFNKPADQPLSTVDTYRSQANPDKEAFINLLNDARTLYKTVRTAFSGFGPTNVSKLNAVVYLLFEILAQNYVRLYLPRVYFLAQALSAVAEASSSLEEEPFVLKRFWLVIRDAIVFALSPIGYTYRALSDGVVDEARAKVISDRIFPQLAIFLAFASTREILYGWDSLLLPDKASGFFSIRASTTPIADAIAERMFTFPLSQQPTPTTSLAELLAVTLAIVPKTHAAKPGLMIGVGGSGKVKIPLSDRWEFLLEASAEPAFSLLLQSEAKKMSISAHGPINAPLNVALVSIPDETNVTYAFPHRDETRIEIGQLVFSFNFDGHQGGIKAEAQRCAIVIAAKDQDSFLAEFLPPEGLRVPFNFGTGAATDRGFFTEGNVPLLSGRSSGAPSQPSAPPGNSTGVRQGLVARTRMGTTTEPTPQAIAQLSGTSQPELGTQQIIAIGKTFLGLRLRYLLLGLAPAANPATAQVNVEVSVALDIAIGPIVATVDRIGFQTGLAFPESGGNLGFADLSLGFKPPSGIGLQIDAAVVSGGGFLAFDGVKGQYVGVVLLNLEGGLTLTAFGLLTTRLPNGAKGFSLVVLITAVDFKPISLGLGFMLTGIGGLLAINRTCNEAFLREGIKNKTLDNLLFPKDPIRNAAEIFGTLNSAFPARKGSYLFGPVVQISWGTPPLLTMDLGLILELGHRTRLIVLGKIVAILPTVKNDLIRLQMNVFGVLDFDQRTVALDAVLYESRLLNKFPLTGAMALRLNWGSSPSFALAIGGFHPAFKPPSGFPSLERVALSLSDTKDFRLRCDAYFAITSNTVQFGAHAELFARAGSFSITGQIGFDVLIQFNPFGFLASFYASVQLKRNSTNLFKVKIEGELAGPKPLHVKGKATFEIFWCSFSVSFDQTLVAGTRPAQLTPVNVMSQLKTALADSRNWGGQLAEGDRRLVTLRAIASGDQIALHPLGNLSVTQKVVPLNLEIAKFGNTSPADARSFTITAVSLGNQPLDVNRLPTTTELFAPAQFLDLTDDEKLAAPAFEAMAAGCSLSVGGGSNSFIVPTNDLDVLEDTVLYETKVIDAQRTQPKQPPPPMVLSADLLSQQMTYGAAARSTTRRTGTAKYRAGTPKYAPIPQGWSVAGINDGTPQPASGLEAGKVVTYAQVFQALDRQRRDNPARAKTLMLLRTRRP